MELSKVRNYYGSYRNDTQVLFELLSVSTWNLLKKAYTLNFSFSEETLTESLVFKIIKQNLSNVKVHKVNRRDESQVGFDWEWWVGSPNNGWLRYSVQAKILNTRKNRYLSLRHPVSVKGKFQIKVLEEYSRKYSTIPLYCFYNWINENKIKGNYWHCQFQKLQFEQLGCTISPLHEVKTIHKKGVQKSFENIHKKSSTIPWRCLFHKPPKISGGKLINSTNPGWYPMNYQPKVYENLPDYLNYFDEQTGEVELPIDLDDDQILISPRWIAVITNDDE